LSTVRKQKGRRGFAWTIVAALYNGYPLASPALSPPELGEYGITCNAIAPGYFETELTAPLVADKAFVARVNDRVPLPRWGKPRDLVGAAIFLASEAASYITAQQIIVDGGLSL
jgi:NAD(P)-dependent dehydrogenase (short-subunit alcohol dehydrogenase family)